MYRLERYKAGRFWAVYDPSGELVAVVLYRRGAGRICEILNAIQTPPGPVARDEGEP